MANASIFAAFERMWQHILLKFNNTEPKVYKQSEEPTDAPIGSFWLDTDAESGSSSGGQISGIVSIAHGGTSATTAADARLNLGFTYGADEPTGTPTTGEGSVYLRTGSDAVIEVGTKDNWTYRKWASGIAECWCKHTCFGVTTTSSWGSMYESSGHTLSEYPFEFAEVPTQTMNVTATGGSAFFVYQYYDSGNTTKSAGTAYFYRPTASTSGQDVVLSIQVIGRWK